MFTAAGKHWPFSVSLLQMPHVQPACMVGNQASYQSIKLLQRRYPWRSQAQWRDSHISVQQQKSVLEHIQNFWDHFPAVNNPSINPLDLHDSSLTTVGFSFTYER